MTKKRIFLTSLMIIGALIVSGFTSQAALAASDPVEKLEYSGTITEVNEGGAPFTFVTGDGLEVTVGEIVGGISTVEVSDGEDTQTYEISVSDGFEFSDLSEDEEFNLEAKYDDENEVWRFTELKVRNQKQERDLLEEHEQEEERERESEGYFCENRDEKQHPVAAGIDSPDKVEYEDVIGMFCAGDGEDGSARTGFGQIMLAFQTAQETETAGDILADRSAGKGWGQIWQDLDLISKPDNLGHSENAGEKPENPGNKPEDPGHGHKPEGIGSGDAGPPEDVNPPGHSKRPDHAGPKK